jgi:choice-of-anchor B domain-containing protein
MKRIILFLHLFCTTLLQAQEQKNITFLDNWNEDTLVTNTSNVRYSGSWGFTRNNTEYAIIGSTEGTHFFKLSNENKLIQCGFVEGRFNSSQVIHREFKTYGNYAYSICDEGNSSLQIIDLSYLPDSVVKVADLQDLNFGKTHNLTIDTTNALLYACLVTPIVAGIELSLVPLRVFSLADPINPVLLWEGPSDIPIVHDCYVRDNIALLNCGDEGLRVYDFTNPSTPNYINNLTFYQDQGYNHQGWLSPDGLTYVFADETNGKRVKKCTVGSDYSIQVESFFGTNYENNSVPHNIMCTDQFAFVAYYIEGLRIFDIRNAPIEIASYDTYPTSSNFKMNGAWGVFSNYLSGRIIVSDRQNGLFLLHFDQSIFMNEASDEFNIYPNPASKNGKFIVRSAYDEIAEFTVNLYNNVGELIMTEKISNQSYGSFSTPEISGVYTAKIAFVNYLGEQEIVVQKLISQ